MIMKQKSEKNFPIRYSRRNFLLVQLVASIVTIASGKASKAFSFGSTPFEAGTNWYTLDKNSVNVLNYGATGDGVTDDSMSIQTAIDFAQKNSAGVKPVYFPPGKYRIERSINLPSNSNLVGNGKQSLLIGIGAIPIFLAKGKKVVSGTIQDKIRQYLDNIKLSGLSFVSTHVFNGDKVLVSFIFCKNCIIQDCYFYGHTYNSSTASVEHIALYTGCYKCSFYRNTFFAPGATGSHTSCYGFNGLNDGSVSMYGYSISNTCYSVGDTGLGMWTGTKYVQSVGDTFYLVNPGYTSVGIDCAGVTGAKIDNACIYNGSVAVRIGINLNYVDRDIEINNIFAHDQTEQGLKVYHNDFSLEINGGSIITTQAKATGIYIGMKAAWTGYLKIKNTIINSIGVDNKAIIFDLVTGHKLTLYESNPAIKAGALMGYSNEFVTLGEPGLSRLVYHHKLTVFIPPNTSNQVYARVKLEPGFYRIVGDYTYDGEYLGLKLHLDSPQISQVHGGNRFNKPTVVQSAGYIEFIAFTPSGGATISNFSIYRIC
jgi:Pectate lyase superfamily protein